MRQKMLTFLLALCMALTLLPAPAQAADTAHFTDVPVDHWAYPYVERAYADGVIGGVGGDPESGTGIFAPNDEVTYGQFLAMMTRAFYPEEVSRVSSEEPWYAPGIQVAVNRQLNFNTRDQLTAMANAPINRYNAAWFLVRILEDKCVVLPDDQERSAAAAAIGDWDDLLEDEYWRYFVSSIYSLGIITGVDRTGAFDGAGYMTRASAAVLYTRMADKLEKDGNDPKAFRITFEGDWSAAPEGYQDALEEEFYTVYPRLWARFGTAETTKHVALRLVPPDEISGAKGITSTGYDYVRFQTTAEIKIIDSYIDDLRHTAAIFAHELTHAATGAARRKVQQSTWLFECLADYGIFRYAAWTDERYMRFQDTFYQEEEEVLRTWDYVAYADSHWFFTYMDAKYPTTSAGYGLLDSILLTIRAEEVTSDVPNGPALNAVVKRVTGYETLDLLRQRYVEELDGGTWTFNGFAGFADNYITENLPGVPDPAYLITSDFNLCGGAATYYPSSEASEQYAGNNLVDGDRTTKWQTAEGDGRQPEIYIRLDKEMTFDTYVLYHEGNGGQNTVSWRIRYKVGDTDEWKVLDEVTGNTEDVTVRTVAPVTAQYLKLELTDPSGTGDGIARLYELEIYDGR